MNANIRIPFILGAFAAIFTGVASIKMDIPVRQIYIKMIIALVTFSIAGFYLESTINKIKHQMDEENSEEKCEEVTSQSKDESKELTEEKLPDVFTPLDISEAVRSVLKK